MAGYARGRDAVKMGVLATVAVIAFAALFMKMTDRGLSLTQWDVHVRIPAAGGLKKRDRVFFRGVDVGEVRSMAFMDAGDVLVQVHLSQRIPLTRASVVELIPLDLFGRQSLVFRDGVAESVALADGDTVQAAMPVSMTGQVTALANRGEALLSNETIALLRRALDGAGEAGQSVAALTARMEALLAAQEQALTTVLEQVAALAANLNAATDTARVAEMRMDVSGVLDGLTRLTARLDSTAAASNAVLATLRTGQGSAGLLLTDPELYQRINDLLASADELLKDIKAHPKKYINVSVF